LLGLAVVAWFARGGVRSPKTEASVWVTTWATSQTGSPANGPQFSNQTLRLNVRVSLGGTALRVRISNPFGARDIVVGAATIRAGDHGQPTALTFAAAASVTLPAGGSQWSDPALIGVASGEVVTVSLYVASDTGPVSIHPAAAQLSWLSPVGNFVASRESFPVPLVFWPLLSALEVLAPAGARTVVAFGESITDGLGSTRGAHQSWPDLLADRFTGLPVAVVNSGLGGNRLLAAGASLFYGPSALERFDRDALSIRGVSQVVVLLGINDVVFDAKVTADDLLRGTERLAARAHERGVKVSIGTLLPFGRAAVFTRHAEERRRAFNDALRKNAIFDGVVDFEHALGDASDPPGLRSEFDSGDHWHPNDAGYRAMAEAIDLRFFAQ
jgi:lysophospholipase L1-like esterase